MTNIGMNPYTGLPYNQDNFNGIAPAAIPVSDQVKDTPAGNAVSGFPTTPDEFVKVAPYYGLGIIGGFGIKNILDKLCGTNTAFSESPLAKFTQNLDGKTNSLNEKIKGWFSSGKGKIEGLKSKTPKSVDRFYNNQIKDIVEHAKVGTEPTWSLARQQYHGVSGMAADAFKNQVKELIESGKVSAKYANKLLPIVKNEKVSSIQAVKDMEAALGKDGFNKFISEYSDIPRAYKIPYTKIEIPFIKNTTNLTSSLNKYKGLEAANTENYIARGVQKVGLIAGEGLSGAVIGGGALGVVINALMMGGAIKKAVEAPKGEKLSTFMEEFMTNYFGFLITMPLAEKILYKSLGARNLGTEKNIAQALAKHTNLQSKIKTVNKNATIKDGIIELAERLKGQQGEAAKATQAEIKALNSLAAKETTLLQRPVKAIARFFSAGLGEDAVAEVFKNKNTLPKAVNFVKRWGGGGMRFLILMAVVAPVLTKPFAWFSHAVFGTPTATKKEEEKAKHKDENQQVTNNNMQPNQMNQTNQVNQTNQMNQMNPVNQPNQMNQMTPVAQNTQQTNMAQQANGGIVRTYIPSPAPAVFQPQQNAAIQAELQKSDKIIKHYGELVNTSH